MAQDEALIYAQGLGEPWEREPKEWEPFHQGRTFRERFLGAGGHCVCDEVGGDTCERCRERRQWLRTLVVCRCGRLLLRAWDAACPVCDPGVFKVAGKGVER